MAYLTAVDHARIGKDRYNVNQGQEPKMLEILQGQPQFQAIDNGLLVRAPAKINLSLLVVGKRPDGYHQLKTVMAKVSFYDLLWIRRTGRPGIALTCSGPCWAPSGGDNLVLRAAKGFVQAFGIADGLHITLEKHIPAGSGLGSASSDAAATLLGLSRLFGPAEVLIINRLAEQLGSDVPFFLAGPISLCTGRGEIVQAIQQEFSFVALLILPQIHCSTSQVYANYRHDQQAYETLDEQVSNCLRTGRLYDLCAMDANMLASSCLSLSSELAVLRKRVEQLIGHVSLSGTGAAMFKVFSPDAQDKAEACGELISKEIGCASVIVHSNDW